MRHLALLVCSIALSACSTTPEPHAAAPAGQSFRDALTTMCDVDRLAKIDADANPLEAGTKRTAFIAERVDNPDGIELRTLLSVKGATDQAKMLRDRAKEAGLGGCALAESLEKNGAGGLSP